MEHETLQNKLRSFHTAFGHPVDQPYLLVGFDHKKNLRMKLIREEYEEIISAIPKPVVSDRVVGRPKPVPTKLSKTEKNIIIDSILKDQNNNKLSKTKRDIIIDSILKDQNNGKL